MTSIDEAQDALLAHIRSEFAQPVFEVAVPVEVTMLRDDFGMLPAYIAIQFGDLQLIGARNMATAAAHNYTMPFYMGIVASDADAAKRLANRLNVVLLGFSVPNGGQVEKRAGGQIYSLPAQMGSYEAYVAPCSFGVQVEVFE